MVIIRYRISEEPIKLKKGVSEYCTNTTDILGYADPIAEAECLSCASDGVAGAPRVKGGAEF